MPLEAEEEDTPENSSVNVDVFTKATTSSHTDPATGDIVLVRWHNIAKQFSVLSSQGDGNEEDSTVASTSKT